jgi:hypothetical protein
MNLQYVSDSEGRTTGVFIPIDEWDELKEKIKKLEQVDGHIPEWHKTLVTERIEDYKKNPGDVMDLDAAMDDIEKEL